MTVPPLDADERAELDRLRREAAARADATAGGRADAGTDAGTDARAGRPRTGRWLGAVVLLVLAAVLAVASVVTGFVRAEVLDTERYVATVAPLARDPAVQDAIAGRLADEIVTAVDLQTRVQQLADEVTGAGAPELLDALVAPIVSGIRTFLHTEIRSLLATDEFARIWDTANRVTHDELVALLTTGQGEFLTAEGNQVYVDLGAVLALVRDRLVSAGFTLAQEIPELTIRYPVFQSDQLPELRTAAYLLDQARWVFPLAAVLLLAGGLALAPDRRRGALLAAVLTGAAVLAGLGGLALGRSYYLSHLPAGVLDREAAEVFFDTFFRFLADTLRTLTVLAAIVAVLAWIGGPGPVPSALRRGAGRTLDAGAGLLGRGGVRGPVPTAVGRHRQAAEVGVVVAAVAVLVLWRQPGVSGTLWLTAGVLALLAVVELIGRVPARPAAIR